MSVSITLNPANPCELCVFRECVSVYIVHNNSALQHVEATNTSLLVSLIRSLHLSLHIESVSVYMCVMLLEPQVNRNSGVRRRLNVRCAFCVVAAGRLQ